jgi:polyphosphate kinase
VITPPQSRQEPASPAASGVVAPMARASAAPGRAHVEPAPPDHVQATSTAATTNAATDLLAAEARYFNRELSWLDWNQRVLFEAGDLRNPLLDRARFLSIFARNLDEFFEIRVAGLLQQRQMAGGSLSSDGLTATDQLGAIRQRVLRLVEEQARLYREVGTELAEQGIRIADYDEIPAFHESLRERFLDEIFPVLTPLAVDPGHPFPYISTLTLSLAIELRDPQSGEQHFARVKVPAVLPRFLEVAPAIYVPIEQVIAANLDLLFSGMDVLGANLFRVTRNADLAIEEDEADDLLEAIEEELRRRRFGAAVRLEVEPSMPTATRQILLSGIRLDEEDLYEVGGLLDLGSIDQLAGLDRPDLRSPVWAPIVPARLAPSEEDGLADVFAAIRAGDILVHHPYESFGASVERFIGQATDDPDVLTIKQTLYRTTGDSLILHNLIRAAEQGKQVVVLVELKARFDEEANIEWARKLERAGAHVVYGLVGLKTHSKVALVVRREGSGLRRYVHIGTGNYNPTTARLYTDLGLLSCRPELGADVTELFNSLTGLSRQRSFRRLVVAPLALRSRIIELIEREVEHARAGRPAGVVIKVNGIVDPACIDALYLASQAGVPIDVIARSICSLRPGVPGLSETIRVRSIVGAFLEHSRIFGFRNGGEDEWYIGSADLMERNLDRRVEALVPLDHPDARARIGDIVAVMLADDRRSWQLAADGSWQRTETLVEGEATGIDTFAVLKARAAGIELEPVAARHPARVSAGRGGPRRSTALPRPRRSPSSNGSDGAGPSAVS